MNVRGRDIYVWNCHCLLELPFYRDASDQQLKKKEGNVANQQRNAIAVADWSCTHLFTEQRSRSLSIRTVMPAHAHAAANVSVVVICRRRQEIQLFHCLQLTYQALCTQNLVMAIMIKFINMDQKIQLKTLVIGSFSFHYLTNIITANRHWQV